MSIKLKNAEIQIDIEHLDPDAIDEHLRNSAAVLQCTLKSDDESSGGLSCQHCGKMYKTTSTLHSHIVLMHPQDNSERRCTECDKTYPSVLSLRKHIRYMHLYNHRCKVCYKTFATLEYLLIHGESCINSETPCPKCGKMYGSRVSLKNHLKYKHPEEMSHWCEPCRRSFSSNQRLMNHRATIHPPGATTCVQCDKAFVSVTALHSHVLYKHADDSARCLQCHKVFAKKTYLQKHCAKQHRDRFD